jgi:crotonobetainyl-CoA:carnitine CoA-transferase CaiB-like acyl-CoA transferase
MPQAFSNYRVLDFSTTIAGPHCTRLLADLGAEVIKIEAPGGDMMRLRPPLRHGASGMFGQLNAGKKSVVMDLKAAPAVAAIKRLVKEADILVENYRPGVMQKFGLGYSVLAEINPTLIYCSISGYGQDGPAADQPAYAPVIHAASGYDLAHTAYQPDRDRPDYCGIFIADVLTGTYAFGAIGAAMAQRHKTGLGQHIDTSMLESMLSLTLIEMQAAQFEMPPRPSRPLFGPIETSDGYVNLAVASERTFEGMAAAAGRKDWLTDPRFAEYITRRVNWGELMDEFEAWSSTLSSGECLRVLAQNNVPATAYRTVREAMADPQLAHRGAFAEVHDAGGAMQVLNPPFRMSASATRAGARVAALGEHTEEVLAAAGLEPDEIAAVGG